MTAGLTSIQVRALRQARDDIERMVRKNEKSNLLVSLSRWNSEFAAIDPDPNKTQDGWFFAACHKQGEGVARILFEGGAKLHAWTPVHKALEREFDALAFFLAGHIGVLEPVEQQKEKVSHVLVEAARRGRMDALMCLFERPESPPPYIKAAINPAPDLVARANFVLLALARTHGHLMHMCMEDVVKALIEKGGQVDYRNPEGFSIFGRMPLAWQAAQHGNACMLRALHHNGANLVGVLGPEDRMPHPFPTTISAALHGASERYGKNRALIETDWDTLEFLADLGVAFDQQNSSFKRLTHVLSPSGKRRLERLVGVAHTAQDWRAMDGAATQVARLGAKRRL